MRNHTIYIEAQNFTEYSINSNCKSQVQAYMCNFPSIFSTCLLQEDYEIFEFKSAKMQCSPFQAVTGNIYPL